MDKKKEVHVLLLASVHTYPAFKGYSNMFECRIGGPFISYCSFVSYFITALADFNIVLWSDPEGISGACLGPALGLLAYFPGWSMDPQVL